MHAADGLYGEPISLAKHSSIDAEGFQMLHELYQEELAMKARTIEKDRMKSVFASQRYEFSGLIGFSTVKLADIRSMILPQVRS